MVNLLIFPNLIGHSPRGFLLLLIVFAIIAIIFLILASGRNVLDKLSMKRIFNRFRNEGKASENYFIEHYLITAERAIPVSLNSARIESQLRKSADELFDANGVMLLDFCKIGMNQFCLFVVHSKNKSYVPGDGDYMSVTVKNYELWLLEFDSRQKKISIRAETANDAKEESDLRVFSELLLSVIC